ncbi:hypothetical protein K435DRAFT_646225 [Dendrothele bispora CBS 962.96]|uniref:HAT C-terminal dimerisation domain-containing protein n=1 Tax=Dendrothele bispora (strain CBS 962.96) TaxID=1314807 RepID=A0A4V4HIB8_DENBC|nr:hypothetical protein K435DRAFT_903439 [Dendrothele bispora CBS 962.96]THV05936.1 hypothetical protein K435DRAFT_646225 [Dendrothele bispora CBS 962.96]
MNEEMYPTWASLSHDYPAINIISSVSERTFSSASITISKCCNRLKLDIFEALQFLKCMIHKNIIFQELLVSTLEDETESKENEEECRD